MRRLVLPFTTEDIIIATPDKIKDSEWEEVSEKLRDKLTDIFLSFHPTEPDSVISRLHNSGAGYPIPASPSLIELLSINSYYFEHTEGAFSLVDPKNISINLENFSITRNSDVKIQISPLFTEFTLMQLDRILEGTSIRNYLISGPNSYVCRGTQQWEVKFSHPTLEQPVEIVVVDEAVLMAFAPDLVQNISKVSTPFSGNIPIQEQIVGGIIESADLIHSKVAASKLFDNLADYQFQNFVDQWKCGATLLLGDGSFQQYTSR